MKTTVYYFLSIAIIVSLGLSSCGPGKKLVVANPGAEGQQKSNPLIPSKLNNFNSHVNTLYENNRAANENYASNDYFNEKPIESKMTMDDQQERLQNLHHIIQKQMMVMNNLKDSLTKALKLYKPDELYVYMKDGNVYVSLEEKLLFQSGSLTINPKGKEALETIAVVLNNNKEITIIVEGHTDNFPGKTEQSTDSWEISTGRASAVIRTFTGDFGVNPGRVIASGRGEFHPINTNDNDAGRTGNRRTEIILSHDLNELYSLLVD
jgi:chemotaxis protein MotB